MFFQGSLFSLTCSVWFLLVVPASKGDVVFDFEADPVGRVTPFTDTVNGLSATFNVLPPFGPAAVCNVSALGFQTLTGNALIETACLAGTSGPLDITFSSDLADVVFDFATALGPDIFSVEAFEKKTPVGTKMFRSQPPLGRLNGEGQASFSEGLLDELVLSSNVSIAVDNIEATKVPEPACFSEVMGGLVCFVALFSGKRRR